MTWLALVLALASCKMASTAHATVGGTPPH